MSFKNKSNDAQSVCNVDFSGLVGSSTLSVIIAEYFKYLLYERQQIPLPHNQLKDFDSIKWTDDEDSKPRSSRKSGKDLKRQRALDTIDKILSTIHDVFQVSPNVHQILIVFGATVISPKEQYLITLPPECCYLDPLSSAQAKLTLFRNIIKSDYWIKLSEMKLQTKVHIFLKAPSCEKLSELGLWPKARFTMASKGKILTVNCQYKPCPEGLELSQLDDTEFEISGIEPLNDTANELDCSIGAIGSPSTANKDMKNKSKSLKSGENGDDGAPGNENEPIWYQIQHIFTGFK